MSFVNISSAVLKTMKPYSAVIIIGHFNDPAKLAAAGLGNSILVIGLLSILGGVNRPLDTLNTQAYGRGDFKLCGSYLNKGRIIQTVFFIPPALILFTFASTLFELLDQPPEVVEYGT